MREATTAVVFDLDSTLRDSQQRHHLSPARNMAAHQRDDPTLLTMADWNDYCKAGLNDAPIPGTIAVMRAMSNYHQIHVVSGSGEGARHESQLWLERFAPWWDYLELRREDGVEAGMLAARYIRRLQDSGTPVVVAFNDWRPAAEQITQLTGVPVVVVNPCYDGMCTCGHASQLVE